MENRKTVYKIGISPVDIGLQQSATGKCSGENPMKIASNLQNTTKYP